MILHRTAITVAESESDIRITTDIPYLTLTGELWGAYCEDLAEDYIDLIIYKLHCIKLRV